MDKKEKSGNKKLETTFQIAAVILLLMPVFITVKYGRILPTVFSMAYMGKHITVIIFICLAANIIKHYYNDRAGLSVFSVNMAAAYNGLWFAFYYVFYTVYLYKLNAYNSSILPRVKMVTWQSKQSLLALQTAAVFVAVMVLYIYISCVLKEKVYPKAAKLTALFGFLGFCLFCMIFYIKDRYIYTNTITIYNPEKYKRSVESVPILHLADAAMALILLTAIFFIAKTILSKGKKMVFIASGTIYTALLAWLSADSLKGIGEFTNTYTTYAFMNCDSLIYVFFACMLFAPVVELISYMAERKNT